MKPVPERPNIHSGRILKKMRFKFPVSPLFGATPQALIELDPEEGSRQGEASGEGAQLEQRFR
jgi:hypothetical protein